VRVGGDGSGSGGDEEECRLDARAAVLVAQCRAMGPARATAAVAAGAVGDFPKEGDSGEASGGGTGGTGDIAHELNTGGNAGNGLLRARCSEAALAAALAEVQPAAKRGPVSCARIEGFPSVQRFQGGVALMDFQELLRPHFSPRAAHFDHLCALLITHPLHTPRWDDVAPSPPHPPLPFPFAGASGGARRRGGGRVPGALPLPRASRRRQLWPIQRPRSQPRRSQRPRRAPAARSELSRPTCSRSLRTATCAARMAAAGLWCQRVSVRSLGGGSVLVGGHAIKDGGVWVLTEVFGVVEMFGWWR